MVDKDFYLLPLLSSSHHRLLFSRGPHRVELIILSFAQFTPR